MPNGIRDISKEITAALQGTRQEDLFEGISLDIDPLRGRITETLLEDLSPEAGVREAETLALEQLREQELIAGAPSASQQTAQILADLSRGAPSPAPFAAVAESIAANRAQQIAGLVQLRSEQRAEERSQRALRTQTAATLGSLLRDIAQSRKIGVETRRTELFTPAELSQKISEARIAGVEADTALDRIQSELAVNSARISEMNANTVLIGERAEGESIQNTFDRMFEGHERALGLRAGEADIAYKNANTNFRNLMTSLEAEYGAESRQLANQAAKLSIQGEIFNQGLDRQYKGQEIRVNLGRKEAELARAEAEAGVAPRRAEAAARAEEAAAIRAEEAAVQAPTLLSAQARSAEAAATADEIEAENAAAFSQAKLDLARENAAQATTQRRVLESLEDEKVALGKLEVKEARERQQQLKIAGDFLRAGKEAGLTSATVNNALGTINFIKKAEDVRGEQILTNDEWDALISDVLNNGLIRPSLRVPLTTRLRRLLGKIPDFILDPFDVIDDATLEQLERGS